jgi:hypothetical protein
MTNEELQAIRARHAATTPGTWDALIALDETGVLWERTANTALEYDGGFPNPADPVFIAAAHNADVPALCDALEAAWAELARLRGST